ncbi:TfoX/Sxy family protein [Candidatus Methanomassiliicoccus intestinalis]|jgi:putative transcriptional regulator|nr:TfoX/Sxy family protein [Candidatus Methanomassiliicoccus intestinalis]TQS82224.1 MAG: competence protein TfoX [Candidatus Methanomassiliicoccus intestinalis]TQS84810.1 MAG: competence protein TfoX [Candidatus Methanomassiliicoccus intestinalis]
MVSSKTYLDRVLNGLSGLDEITYRSMMGEYIIYYRGKIVGGIYDDRLLIKPTASAKFLMPAASYVLPYDGAKEMLYVENIDDKDNLTELLESIYPELPAPKSKKK